METGHRFRYTYETSRGRSFYIVDPVKKTKTPIFDNARMAALLTQIVLTPYDAQHLPDPLASSSSRRTPPSGSTSTSTELRRPPRRPDHESRGGRQEGRGQEERGEGRPGGRRKKRSRKRRKDRKGEEGVAAKVAGETRAGTQDGQALFPLRVGDRKAAVLPDYEAPAPASALGQRFSRTRRPSSSAGDTTSS